MANCACPNAQLLHSKPKLNPKQNAIVSYKCKDACTLVRVSYHSRRVPTVCHRRETAHFTYHIGVKGDVTLAAQSKHFFLTTRTSGKSLDSFHCRSLASRMSGGACLNLFSYIARNPRILCTRAIVEEYIPLRRASAHS